MLSGGGARNKTRERRNATRRGKKRKLFVGAYRGSGMRKPWDEDDLFPVKDKRIVMRSPLGVTLGMLGLNLAVWLEAALRLVG